MTTTKAIRPIEEVRNTLTAMTPQFKMALPAHITPDKFVRTVMTALQQSPDLLNCDRTSLLASCTKAAGDGLLPDGREAAIVKFGNTAQYMPMVAGLCKKARNSGEVSSLTAMEVYENDKFRYWIDSDGEHIEHEPVLFGERGALKGFYGLAKLKDGSIIVEPMPLSEVEKIRNVSRAKNAGPWKDWFSEMGKKTVIRRMSKYRLPSSTDLLDSLRKDDDLFMPDPQAEKQESGTIEALPAEPKKRTSRLKDAISVKANVVEPSPTQPPPMQNAEAGEWILGNEEQEVDRPAIVEHMESNDLDAALNNDDPV